MPDKAKRYAEKQVFIEAMLFTGFNEYEIAKWLRMTTVKIGEDGCLCLPPNYHISNGPRAKRGNWVVLREDRVFACDPKEFQRRYTLVTDESDQ